jgi:heat shock protein HtpX
LIYDEIAKNRNKSIFTLILYTIFVLIVCYFIGIAWLNNGIYGLIIGFIISIIMSLVSYYSGDSIVLSSVGAVQIQREDSPVYYDVVKELTIASGLPMPKVYIVPDPSPNAFATGRNPENSKIAVNEGLLNILNREELQGVIAHELSHIRNYDILFGTVVSVLLGMVIILSMVFRRSLWFSSGRRSSRDNNGGAVIMIIGLILAIFAPIAAQLIQLALSRRREYLADASGALITRNPIGLANALRKLSESNIKTRTSNDAVAPLYITAPFKGIDVKGLFSTHPPIEERIKRLEEMAYVKQ